MFLSLRCLGADCTSRELRSRRIRGRITSGHTFVPPRGRRSPRSATIGSRGAPQRSPGTPGTASGPRRYDHAARSRVASEPGRPRCAARVRGPHCPEQACRNSDGGPGRKKRGLDGRASGRMGTRTHAPRAPSGIRHRAPAGYPYLRRSPGRSDGSSMARHACPDPGTCLAEDLPVHRARKSGFCSRGASRNRAAPQKPPPNAGCLGPDSVGAIQRTVGDQHARTSGNSWGPIAGPRPHPHGTSPPGPRAPCEHRTPGEQRPTLRRRKRPAATRPPPPRGVHSMASP